MKNYLLATEAPADRETALELFNDREENDDGVSAPMWFRLPTGDLILGIVPLGETYEAYHEEANEAIMRHGVALTMTEDELVEIAPTKPQLMEEAARIVLAQPGTVSETKRRNAAVRLAELALGKTDENGE